MRKPTSWVVWTSQETAVSSSPFHKTTTTLRTFSISYCHIPILLSCLHITDMAFSTSFSCDICRRNPAHNPLDIFRRYTRCPIWFDGRTQITPVNHYMIRCGYIQFRTICKNHYRNNWVITDLFQYRFNGSRMGGILTNRISQFMLFTWPAPESLFTKQTLFPLFRVLMSEYPTFIIFRFDYKDAVWRNYDVVYLSCSIVSRQ